MPLTDISLIERVKTQVALVSGAAESELTEATRLDELAIDSLEFVDLMVNLGIPDMLWQRAITVGDLIRLTNDSTN